ncbi:MAG: TraB/GumN family protein [Limnospira sp.]
MPKIIQSFLLTAVGRLTSIGLISTISILSGSRVADSQTAESKQFLWEVETPQNRVYLLGSIHVLSQNDYPLPPMMETAFEEAENVVFELDLNELESLETQALMLEKATPPGGQTLRDLIQPETYQVVENTMANLGFPIQVFRNFEPWFVSVSLVALQLQRLGFDPQYGVDRYFFEKAIATQTQILTLETVEEQLSLFDELPPEEQDKLLRQTLEEIDLLETSFQDMLIAWKTGDTQTLANLILTGFQDYPVLAEKIFRDRNQKWMAKIDGFLGDDEDYLIVVGAGHLVGEEGLVAMLRDRGYSVEQH